MQKTAFVFAGQGAQTPQMGKKLYENSAAARAVFDEAGADIKRLCFEANQDELNLTINAQPAIYTVSLAHAAALNERGIKADGAAGFSLGEISAAAYAGLFTFAEGLAMIRVRAEAMSKCASDNPGCMFAVLKLTSTEIERLCAEAGEGCYPANYNAPGQTVVSCAAAVADVFTAAVKAANGRAVPLATQGAFHSPLMQNAQDTLGAYLENREFTAPKIPLFANVTALPYPTVQGEIRQNLSRQITSPVLWQKTIENMTAAGFDTFAEIGPGNVLSGLIKRITDVHILEKEEI